MEPLFAENEKLLKWSGFWPSGCESSTRGQLILDYIKMLSLIGLCCGWTIYPQIYYLYANSDSVKNFSFGFTFTITMWLCLYKMFMFVVFRCRLSKLISDMRRHWDEYTTECKDWWNGIRARNQEQSRLLALRFIIFWNLNSIGAFSGEFLFKLLIVLFTGQSLTYEMIPYPIPELFPFDHKDIGVFAKCGISISTIIAVGISVYIGTVIDATLLTLLNNSSHFLEFVRLKIRQLDIFQTSNGRKLDSEITEILKCHNIAFQFIEEIEKIFKIFMIIQYFSSTFILCVTAFSLTLLLEDMKILIIIVVYTICMNLQIALMSYYGSKVMNQSFTVADEVWDIKWYEKSAHFKRTMMFIMMRAQKPVGLSAAKFFFINLSTFARVLSASFSYFTILRNLLQ